MSGTVNLWELTGPAELTAAILLNRLPSTVSLHKWVSAAS